jgi:hypothetical protein
MTTLSDYLLDTTDILRDSSMQFTTQAQLTRYINRARNEVAKRTACLEAVVQGQSPFGTSAQPGNMIPGAFIPGTLPGSNPGNSNEAGATATASNQFVTIPGVELYTYNYGNPFLQGQYQGYDKIIYVFNVSCDIGGYTPTLRWLPWDMLQAYGRAYNLGVTSYPSLWSAKGVGENGQVWLFPMPTNMGFATMIWQCICTPKPLYSNADFDALPGIYASCVKYYAAYLAYMGQQRSGMAQIMRGLFDEQLQISGVASDWGHVENYYPEGI